MTGDAYYQRIELNIEIINTLDKAQYPFLYAVLCRRKEANKQRLLYILNDALTIENQQGGQYGYWYFKPLTAFANDKSNNSNTVVTWYKYTIFFACLGLIERHITTDEEAARPDANPYDKKLIESRDARKKKSGRPQKATAKFSIPEYNARQLEYIEHNARKWIESKANFNQFGKTTALEVFGSRIANRVYQDRRTKPIKAVEEENGLAFILAQLLQEKPFTTIEELFAASGESSKAQRIWERGGAKQYILQMANAKAPKKPSNEEKKKYNLSNNKYIIEKIDCRS